MSKKVAELAEELGAEVTDRTTTEAGAIVWWDMYDADGSRVNITLRASTYQQATALLTERRHIIDKVEKGGWTAVRQVSQPAAPATPHQTLQQAFPNNSSDSGSFDTSNVRKDNVGFLVQGGNFTEFGIRAWPEVWEAAGIVPEEGSLVGYVAHWGLNNKGHKKIVGIQPK